MTASHSLYATDAGTSAVMRSLQRLAPFVAVAALAYPTLVWPLLEAEPVSLEPVYGQPTVDGPPSALLRVYFSAVFALGLASLAVDFGRRTLGLLQPVLLLLAAYLGWAGLTALWAVEPEISTRRFLLAVFICGGIVCSTLATPDPRRILRIAFWMFAVMTLISTFKVLTEPPTALGHAAFYPHKNYFAAITSIMVLFALHELATGTRLTRSVAVAMLLIAPWFLLEARSKTCNALAILVPAISYSAMLLARHARVSPAISIPALALMAWGVYEFGAQSGLWDFHAFAQTVFGDPTLTQRTDIWQFALSKIAQRPWLGYGYEVFWGAGADSPSVREGPGFVAQMPHAHNGYLDIVLQTGLVGLAIFGCMILTGLHAAGRLARTAPALATLVLSLIVFSLLYNLLETTWFRSFSLKSMCVALAFALAVPQSARRS